VRRSLSENDLTVLSIFVNPAQFTPQEDLASYPRTLPRDLEFLSAQAVPVPNPSSPNTTLVRTPSVVFLPALEEMYPSGISQDIHSQRGTFIELKGYGHQMEGQSRPTFFRGVATVVTKLFNAVEVRKLLSRLRPFIMYSIDSLPMLISVKRTYNKPCSYDVFVVTSFFLIQIPSTYIFSPPYAKERTSWHYRPVMRT